MDTTRCPDAGNDWALDHVCLMADSLQRLTGRNLHPDTPETPGTSAWAKAMFDADFALLSHGTEPEPIFNYGNRCALELFEMRWPQFARTPSRQSAEPAAQATREAFMARVREHGFVDDYSGVRISSNGRRFTIEQTVVWNLVDAAGNYRGQAATFSRWRDID